MQLWEIADEVDVDSTMQPVGGEALYNWGQAMQPVWKKILKKKVNLVPRPCRPEGDLIFSQADTAGSSATAELPRQRSNLPRLKQTIEGNTPRSRGVFRTLAESTTSVEFSINTSAPGKTPLEYVYPLFLFLNSKFNWAATTPLVLNRQSHLEGLWHTHWESQWFQRQGQISSLSEKPELQAQTQSKQTLHQAAISGKIREVQMTINFENWKSTKIALFAMEEWRVRVKGNTPSIMRRVAIPWPHRTKLAWGHPSGNFFRVIGNSLASNRFLADLIEFFKTELLTKDIFLLLFKVNFDLLASLKIRSLACWSAGLFKRISHLEEPTLSAISSLISCGCKSSRLCAGPPE